MALAVRKILYYICILFLLFSFTNCKKRSQTPSDTVVMGIAASPPTLDPRFARDSIGANIRSLLFSSLVRVGSESPTAPVSVQPDLAESWSYKNNVFHFQLRPGVAFSDGSPLTAEDIEFSFAEYQKDSNPFSSAFKKIKKVVAKYNGKDHFVDISVDRFESTFYFDLALVQMLPKKQILAHDKDFYEHLVGSGAFTLVSANENELIFHARENHYRHPKIKTLLLKVIRDDNTRFQKLYKGSLDLVQADIPLSKMSVFKNSPRFNVYDLPGANVTYLLFNLRDPLLKNKFVREAINYAINRAEIIKYKLEGYATPASTFVIPSTPYFDPTIQLANTDIEKGIALLKNLPKPIEIELKTSNQKYAIENGRILAHQIEKLGVSVKMKSFEWGTYYDDISKGNFQMSTMKFVGVWDPDHYRLVFHSQQTPPNGFNRAFYINKELDPLLEEGQQIEDLPLRIEHYKKIQKIIVNDLPLLPLWYDQYVAVVNKRIKNFIPSPLGGFQFLFEIEKETAKNE
ncbi:ABC transporter substrate-binding protein [bacterium]|nr:ABC transporter substrate-binding protein [bacterium]